MHPIYSSIFENKKKVFEEGGLEALEASATGGKDLMTLLCWIYSLTMFWKVC